jgi:phosphoserine phosphatase
VGNPYKLVVFDMDGVLVDHASSWTWVHDKMGVDNEEAFLLFKEGKITETEFIRRDVGLWLNKDPGMKIDAIIDALRDIPLINGIRKTVETLSANGIRSVIVSGGIDKAAEMISKEFGFDGYEANTILTYPDGRLTGEGKVNVDLTDKGIVTRKFMDTFGVRKDETAAVGNSFTDVEMMNAAGFAIAFNPIDDEVVKASDIVIRSRDISDILGVILQVEDGV